MNQILFTIFLVSSLFVIDFTVGETKHKTPKVLTLYAIYCMVVVHAMNLMGWIL